MTDEVHVGRDGWLFLVGGSNQVLRFYMEQEFFRDACGPWIDLLRRRADQARRRGAIYRHIIVPDRLSVYPEFYDGELSYPGGAPCRAMPAMISQLPDAKALSEILINPLPFFDSQKAAGVPLYYKTDSHWTVEGAFSAYALACALLEIRCNNAINSAPLISGPLVLDLGGKVEPQVQEVYRTKLFNDAAQRVEANVMLEYKEANGLQDATGLHVGSRVVFRNPKALDPRKLVLFGDSYSEYRPHLLTGMFAETFAETHFIWSSSIDWQYVDKVKPDFVITELAERFMNTTPDDNFRVDAFAQERVKQYRKQAGKPS